MDDEKRDSIGFIRKNGVSKIRLLLIFCLGLLALCLLLTYKLYDEITHRNLNRKDINDLRTKLDACYKDKFDCNKKHDSNLLISKINKEKDNTIIQQLEQANWQHKAVIQELKERFENVSFDLIDANSRINDLQKLNESQYFELETAKVTLNVTLKELHNRKEAFDAQRLMLEKAQLELQVRNQQTSADGDHRKRQVSSRGVNIGSRDLWKFSLIIALLLLLKL